MKKIMLSVAIVATSFMSGQITLQNTFTIGERVVPFTKDNNMLYFTKGTGNTIKIYNSSYTLIKTVNVPVPNGYTISPYYPDLTQDPFDISKHIFNNDDKLEFIVGVKTSIATPPGIYTKMLLINEDGLLIKDFTNNPSFSWDGSYKVFHDPISNTNKLIVSHNNDNHESLHEVYELPTTALSAKEVQSKSKLSAYPIPTNKILNIMNPSNGSNMVNVYDISGKLVLNKSFSNADNNITIDVENLPKGTYFYKIGDTSSKFIKN